MGDVAFGADRLDQIGVEAVLAPRVGGDLEEVVVHQHARRDATGFDDVLAEAGPLIERRENVRSYGWPTHFNSSCR